MINKFFYIILFFIFPSIKFNASGLKVSSLTSFSISPLYLDGGITTMEVSVNASSTSKVNVTALLINDLYPSGKELFQEIYSSVTTKNYTYRNAYTIAGTNSVKLIYKVGNGKAVENTLNLNVSIGKSYRINSSRYEYTSASAYYTFTTLKKWQAKYESYVFSNFEENYVPSYYHKIDLSNYFIDVTNSINGGLEYDYSYFYITNRNGIYDDFEHDDDLARIPVKIENINNRYQLKFKNTLYVEPYSLKMSSSKKPNYVATQYLYLPKNEQRYEDEYTCDIVINGFGIDRAKFLATFKYKSLSNTIGDCHNSEYCIVNN